MATKKKSNRSQTRKRAQSAATAKTTKKPARKTKASRPKREAPPAGTQRGVSNMEEELETEQEPIEGQRP